MAAGINQPAQQAGTPSLLATDLRLGPGKRYWKDRIVKYILFAAAFSSVAVTTGIVAILLFESAPFFGNVSLWSVPDRHDVDTAVQSDPHFGILPLVAGTLVTTGVALAVALPVGTMIAIYLSEYAPFALREIIKPSSNCCLPFRRSYTGTSRCSSSRRCSARRFRACLCKAC